MDAQLDTLLKEMGEDEAEELEIVQEQEEPEAAAGAAMADDAPVVKLINAILTDAVKRGASDIHIEPFEHEIRVRYRIDGALSEVMKPPMKLKAALISRIKIMSALNIAERRVPQDGRIKLKMGKRVIDFRVSTLPVLFGEKIVMRILDKGNLTLDLSKFGFEPKAEADLMKAILNPYGMVLVTGPTGSGKTTTLYSALSRVNTIEVNIMTAEDPVEYNLMGINQVQVRNEIGMTFAAALKAFLRQDPNIIMVGEIRDIETGSIAIKAALTGHLVLSTLHTNDAPSTITRMIDMGIEPFNVSSAVNLIVAQRLVRRICSGCKAEHTYSDDELKVLGTTQQGLGRGHLLQGQGLREVRGLGLQGPGGTLRGDGLLPGAAAADPPGRVDRRAPEAGGRGRHADPADGRHRQDPQGRHHPRRSGQGNGGRLTRDGTPDAPGGDRHQPARAARGDDRARGVGPPPHRRRAARSCASTATSPTARSRR